MSGITVHCFACPKTITTPTPAASHDAMEAHYGAAHPALIRSLVLQGATT